MAWPDLFLRALVTFISATGTESLALYGLIHVCVVINPFLELTERHFLVSGAPSILPGNPSFPSTLNLLFLFPYCTGTVRERK